jgi:hypothetical protein
MHCVPIAQIIWANGKCSVAHIDARRTLICMHNSGPPRSCIPGYTLYRTSFTLHRCVITFLYEAQSNECWRMACMMPNRRWFICAAYLKIGDRQAIEVGHPKSPMPSAVRLHGPIACLHNGNTTVSADAACAWSRCTAQFRPCMACTWRPLVLLLFETVRRLLACIRAMKIMHAGGHVYIAHSAGGR